MPLHNNRNNARAMYFAAYTGPSMNPTLREPDTMEIVPYDNRPVRVGDVALFQPPNSDQPVVHRIVRVTSAGISTRGDNNSREDTYLLHPKNIKGQVVAAWRGQKRRRITGGLHGRLTNRLAQGKRVIDRGVSPMLHPIYKALSNLGLIARLLPAPFRPRVVVFNAKGRKQFKLLLRQRIIGRYDDTSSQWQIQRPFHLFVDGKALPRQEDRARVNRAVLSERQQTMSHLPPRGLRYNLVLADNSHWEIFAGDAEAAPIVEQLGRVMQLYTTAGEDELSPNGNQLRMLVHVDAHTSVLDGYVPSASENNGVATCILSPSEHWGGPYANLARLSLIIARETQARGGVLIHGALAELDGIGIIMAAPGGTGKTTASNRLPPPWRSLCDDTTLIARDAHGNYWAHPWPTWSRFMDGGPGGTWNVRKAVPLKGIFILDQAVRDATERVGPGHAVSMLVECVRQASMFMPMGLVREQVSAMYLERFNNLCALAKVIAVHVLHISLTGAFWQHIEQALAHENKEKHQTADMSLADSELRRMGCRKSLT